MYPAIRALVRPAVGYDPVVLTRIDHVQLTIPTGAEDAARAFYVGLLGLTERPKPAALQQNGGLWLELGATQLHLGVEDGADRRRTRAHVAFWTNDVAVWRAKLRAAGVEVVEGTPIPDRDRFELRDPFGNRLEVIGPATPPAAASRGRA